MEQSKLYETLKYILIKIKDKNLIWRLERSTNLKVQGIDIIPRDLDIATDEEGITFRKELKSHIIKDRYKEEIKAQSLVCNINGIEIEIIYRNNPKVAIDMFDKIKTIKWHRLDLPILPLENAIDFYTIIKKPERVRIIQDFLNKNQ